MAEATNSTAGYWALGVTTALGLAQSGVFGSKVQKATNPQTAISSPNPAPPPPPVAGQMGTNPQESGVAGHFAQNWKLYVGGAAVIVLAVVLLRRRG